MSKFKKDDKIKLPKQKTYDVGNSLLTCSAMTEAKRTGQDHLFIYASFEDGSYSVGARLNDNASSFAEADLELYEEPKQEIVYNKEYLKNNDVVIEVASEEEHTQLYKFGIQTRKSAPYNYPYSFQIRNGYGWASPRYYKSDVSKFKDWKFVSAQEVIDSLTKTNKTENMKAQFFKIKGKPALIQAIAEDLVELGYELINQPLPKDDQLGVNSGPDNTTISKEDFKKLAPWTGFNHGTNWKAFSLPKDYQEALDFAKEQLDDKYWAPEYKVGDVIVLISDCKFSAKSGAGAKITSIGNPYFNITWIGGPVNSQSNGEYRPNNFRLATPEEIEAFNKPKFKEFVVGSNNTTIQVYKDKLLLPRGEKLLVDKVQALYTKSSMSSFALGDHKASVCQDVRFILIGCVAENNRVSLNDLKKVLDIASSL